jgi:S1-C subfamily serine protease
MSRMRKLTVPILSGLSGGAVVVAVVLALGLGDSQSTSTTVVRQAPLSTKAASDGQALTAQDIYKRDAPGVVFIRSQVVQQSSSPFGMPQQQQGEATGSGFVIDDAGNILTNAHVVEGAVKVTVQFDNDRTVDATVVGTDTSSDLALLHVDPDGLDLHPLQLGSANGIEVGDPVVAIGNPFGLDRTLTTGVVSALQREIQAPDGFTIRNVVQTDAAINPGNSGGPLLDAAGRVIGINSQIATGSQGGGSVGIGFAVPIETAREALPALKHGETVKRPFMGISTRTIDGSLAGLGLPVDQGALVQSVEHGSGAEKAGLKAGGITAQLDTGESIRVGGDIIVAIDGKDVATSDDVAAIVAGKQPGDSVDVTYVRDGQHHTTTVELGNRPAANQG